MNRKLKQTLKQSFTPPPTKHKTEFVNSMSYPKAKFFEVLFSQVGFIRKRVWALYILGVWSAYFYTNYVVVPESIVAVVSAILPLCSLCIITELHRSAAFNMAETELACKYNLQKITLMRLGILGTVSLTVLALLVLLSGKSYFGIFRNTIYIGVPYLLSSYISIGLMSKFNSKEIIYVCTAVCLGVSIFMLLISSSYRFIYSANFVALWTTSFAILTVLTFFSFIKFIKSQEELQWNLL